MTESPGEDASRQEQKRKKIAAIFVEQWLPQITTISPIPPENGTGWQERDRFNTKNNKEENR